MPLSCRTQWLTDVPPLTGPPRSDRSFSKQLGVWQHYTLPRAETPRDGGETYSDLQTHKLSTLALLLPWCHILVSALPRLLELHGRRLQCYSILPESEQPLPSNGYLNSTRQMFRMDLPLLWDTSHCWQWGGAWAGLSSVHKSNRSCSITWLGHQGPLVLDICSYRQVWAHM